jgi:DNA invertase Pin-like site-specific DNA recombinase
MKIGYARVSTQDQDNQVSVFLQSVIFELSSGKKLPLPPKNWQILR